MIRTAGTKHTDATICRILAFLCGYIALLAQTLMFRIFFTTFSGSEWALAVFFATWLFWYGAGSLVNRRAAPPSLPAVPNRLLLYIPFILLQLLLVINARTLLGLSSYETISLPAFIPLLLLVNAPVPFYSGLIYRQIATALHTRNTPAQTPASQIYLIEALGAFCSGILLTLLLTYGLTTLRILTLNALILAAVTIIIQRLSAHPARALLPGLLLTLLTLGTLITGMDHTLSRRLDAHTWHSIIAGGTYRQRFTTPAATYLSGTQFGQTDIIAWSSVTETVPNHERAIQLAIMALAQNPAIQRPLIIGPGSYSLCRTLAHQPAVRAVHWVAPDAHYPSALTTHLDTTTPHLNTPPLTPLEYISAATNSTHDLIIINHTAHVTLADNTSQTTYTLRQLRRILTPNGILCLRMPGGANYLGPELILSGATTLKTVQSVYPTNILIPGEETWIIAARNHTPLTVDPQELYNRLTQSTPPIDLPLEAVWQIYDPSRTDYQKQLYNNILTTHPRLPLNQTDAPIALLYAQLATLRQSLPNLPDLTPAMLHLQRTLPAILLLIILLTGLLRTVVSGPTPPRNPIPLLFAAGFCGFTLNYILLLYFQSFIGTLYTTIALTASLFMLGLTLGGYLSRQLQHRIQRPLLIVNLLYLLTILLTLTLYHLPPPNTHAPMTTLQCPMPNGHSPMPAISFLFLLTGMVTGAYLPICENHLYQRTGNANAGIRLLVLTDALGGAAGALTSGLILIPLLGIRNTLILLGILLPILTIPLRKKMNGPHKISKDALIYLLLLPLAGICGLLAFNQKHDIQQTTADYYAARKAVHQSPTQVCHSASLPCRSPRVGPSPRRSHSGLTPQVSSSPTQVSGFRSQVSPSPTQVSGFRSQVSPTPSPLWEDATLPLSNGLLYPYQTTTPPRLYRIKTQPLTPHITGYAGPIPMQLTLTTNGTLLHIEILPNHETPQHLQRSVQWIEHLLNTRISTTSRTNIDTISGATITASAMRQTIYQACDTFFALINTNAPSARDISSALHNIPDTRLPGKPRNVDIQKIKTMINNNQLSNQPAQ